MMLNLQSLGRKGIEMRKWDLREPTGEALKMPNGPASSNVRGLIHLYKAAKHNVVKHFKGQMKLVCWDFQKLKAANFIKIFTKIR
ncbi:hypothetical protein Nepgr_021576 [Nepenthes gracilis]|uniref:Uncharacterized protein n=1 Tax=Nepenthes gracilis TaxID=150966 RepID=A0AAD3SZ01_NEPGR|nr:hypothetical protein Nepgr_021576 [Nepenthes gracilis]